MGDSDGSLVGQLLGPMAGLPDNATNGLLDGRGKPLTHLGKDLDPKNFTI